MVESKHFADLVAAGSDEAGAIDDRELVIGIASKEFHGLFVQERRDPGYEQPARSDHFADERVEYERFGVTVIVSNVGIGFGQNVIGRQ